MASTLATIQQELRLHATLSSIGFVVLIPLGILIPRYARTFTSKWFYAHAIFQGLIAGPVIVAGVAYGLQGTQRMVDLNETTHFSDPHKQMGLALFVMYIAQVLLGLLSHFVKLPSSSFLLHRTPQQILHIMLGLAIFGLSFYQVNYGYTIEWVLFVGSLVPSNVPTAWKALVILFPILYVLGYVLYPRQLKQEAEYRQGMNSKSALVKEQGYP